MTKPKTYKTRTGRVLAVDEIVAISVEVEKSDYDVAKLMTKRRGRPALGSGPAEIVPVRLDPELRRAVDERADVEHTTASDVIRRALKDYLHVG